MQKLVYLLVVIILIMTAKYKNRSLSFYKEYGFNSHLSTTKRFIKEAKDCGEGFTFSEWLFDAESQEYHNLLIYGCNSKYYKFKKECPINLKTLNPSYNENYYLPTEWLDNLKKLASNKNEPIVFSCNFDNKSSCIFLKQEGFFRHQIACSILGANTPSKCKNILREVAKKPFYTEDKNSNLLKVFKNPEDQQKAFIDNLIANRNPLKSIQFIVLNEGNFLRMLILTNISQKNKKCSGVLGETKLINIAKDER
jgi:hypothetical protein